MNRDLRDFKGIWIPKEIWLVPDLSKMAVLLWSEIHSLYMTKHGGCYASNDYLCEFMGFKERQLQKYLLELKKKGLLEQVSYNGRFRILKAIVPPAEYEKEDENYETNESECGSDPHYSAGQTRRKGRVRPVEKDVPTYIDNKAYNKEERKTPKPPKGARAKARSASASSNSSKSASSSKLYPFGSDSHVQLTHSEYSTLETEFGSGKLSNLIEELNDYLGSTGKRYRSHYSTLKSWYRRKKTEPGAFRKGSKLCFENEDRKSTPSTWKPRLATLENL